MTKNLIIPIVCAGFGIFLVESLFDNVGVFGYAIVGGVFGIIGSFINIIIEEIYNKVKRNKPGKNDNLPKENVIIDLETASNEISATVQEKTELSQIFHHEKENKEEKPEAFYYGFGGWLYLVAIGLVITFGSALYNLFYSYLPLLQNGDLATISKDDPMLGTIFILDIAINLFNIILPLYCGYLCYSLKRQFPKVMIIYYIINFIITVFYSLVIMLISVDLYEIDMREYIKEIFKSAVICAIWIPYFLKSKRVKNTYVL